MFFFFLLPNRISQSDAAYPCPAIFSEVYTSRILCAICAPAFSTLSLCWDLLLPQAEFGLGDESASAFIPKRDQPSRMFSSSQ